ncbi:MAG: N-acetylneuraminate lyase [Firmicutes bacterium]|nr:N-acetylneuraminate lyase [Bacillota bacterium]
MGTCAEIFGGIYPALLTPFTQDGRINRTSLERLVRYETGLGVDGFYVCGSTGESFLMSKEERKEEMEIVKDAAPGKKLIAQIGSLNVRDAEYLARAAADLGYDAISSVAPFYYKFSFREIRDYYFRLAGASDIPVLVYYIPGSSGVTLGEGQLGQLLADDRFIGVKFTSNDFFLLERLKKAYPDKVVLNGFDEMFLSGLAMGADGGIGSTYNFMGDRFVRMRQLMKEGRLPEAREIQNGVNEIIAILLKIGVIPGCKEILNQQGFDLGECLPPFAPLGDEEKQLVREQIIPRLA